MLPLAGGRAFSRWVARRAQRKRIRLLRRRRLGAGPVRGYARRSVPNFPEWRARSCRPSPDSSSRTPWSFPGPGQAVRCRKKTIEARPADPRREVSELPRAEEAARRAAGRLAQRAPRGRRDGAGGRRRQARREPAHRGGSPAGRAEDAAEEALSPAADCRACPAGSRSSAVARGRGREAVAAHDRGGPTTGRFSRRTIRRRRRSVTPRGSDTPVDRVRPGEARKRRADAVAAGRPADADPPRHRSTCWACRRRRKRVERSSGRRPPDAYAEAGRPPARVAAYGERWGRHWLDVARYADTKGYVFTGRAALPLRLHLPRLRHPGLQRGPALRPVRPAAARGRPALPLDDDHRPLAAMGFLTLGRRFLEQPARHHRRPHRRGDARAAGADGRLRPLPRPQVRPDPDRRITTRSTASSPARTSRRSCR